MVALYPGEQEVEEMNEKFQLAELLEFGLIVECDLGLGDENQQLMRMDQKFGLK